MIPISFNTIIKLVSTVITLIVVAGVLFFLYINSPITNVTQEKVVESVANQATLEDENKFHFEVGPITGKIFMALAPKSSERISTLPFFYDSVTKQIVDTELDNYGDDNWGSTKDVIFSPDGNWAAFYGITANDAQIMGWDLIKSGQVYVSKLSSSGSIDKNKLNEIKGNAKKVSNVVGPRKQLFSINNEGEALMVSANNDEPIQLMENHTIRHITSTGVVTEVAKGNYPRWVNDDIFVFVKNDGVYAFSMENNIETLLLEHGGSFDISSNTMMNVSKDGKWLAISFPDAGRVEIYTLDLSNVGAVYYGGLNASGFWPVFSPDSKTLALQEVDWSHFENTESWQDVETSNQALTFWHVQGLFRLEKVVSLNAYRQPYIFISDWVNQNLLSLV